VRPVSGAPVWTIERPALLIRNTTAPQSTSSACIATAHANRRPFCFRVRCRRARPFQNFSVRQPFTARKTIELDTWTPPDLNSRVTCRIEEFPSFCSALITFQQPRADSFMGRPVCFIGFKALYTAVLETQSRGAIAVLPRPSSNKSTINFLTESGVTWPFTAVRKLNSGKIRRSQ
jgi:hypothetical protein